VSADKYSSQRFAEFCDYLIAKNLMSPETAKARKVSSLKILDVLDETEKLDLRSLNREVAFHRFQNRHGSTYTPSSLGVYRSRFNGALDDFFRYSENPSAFRPNLMRSLSSAKPETGSSKKRTANASVPPPRTTEAAEDLETKLSTASESFTLPIPLRPGIVVKIFGLPHDLTQDEAKKISTIIGGYALST